MRENLSIPDLDLQENIREIRERVGLAAEKSGRLEKDIAIMAVTKTVPAQRVNQAIGCGLTLLGENRVQEYLEKYPFYRRKDCSIHFIGRLQTNKVKYIVDKVDMIESVDRVSLAKEIEKRCGIANKKMDVLLEVNMEQKKENPVFYWRTGRAGKRDNRSSAFVFIRFDGNSSGWRK